MKITNHHPIKSLEKALVVFISLLLVSLLIIFAAEPSIYTMTLWPGWVPTERYPWQILLFLGALIIFLGVLMYGVLHHWRWFSWGILIAFTGSVIQVPVEGLQLLGVFPDPYPVQPWPFYRLPVLSPSQQFLGISKTRRLNCRIRRWPFVVQVKRN